MGDNKEGKRKKDKNNDDDDYSKEKKSKRARTRSRSPAEARERDNRRKRRHSRSQSPQKHVKQERPRDDVRYENEVKKDVPERKSKQTDMLNTRTGGAYIPPARLRMMQAQITDKNSVAYQRLAWEALKKSIHGHINKINVGNIGVIIKQLLKENIVRGRGLLCRSIIQAQAASPTFTNVYSALVAAVNSRFPNIGELLLKRLVIQFKRGFKRNDKAICISAASFIGHLVNQRVAHEILALELLTLLVETPTDDSVEVSIAFLKECGQKLTEVSSKGVNAIFEMLRNILHEGQLDKRVQYMIEVMFQVWKDGFKDHPALLDELELVPEEEQFTHLLMLDDATDPQDILNVFKFDEKYEDNEQKYKNLSKEILGSDAESDGEGSGESGSEESDDEEEGETEKKEMTIIDNTETNLIALRRTIYLTINSSLDFEECAHKLLKMQLKPGQEVELCHMFLDCCAEQRTYEKFYGLLAQRFCNINRIYIGPFEEIFKDSYGTAHRLDTNRLRNVSKFFAHLLFTDSIGWEVLDCVRLNEEDTTSSSRIYIKILFQELAEYMGLKKLNDRLKDPTLQDAFLGVFPRDNPKNTRFSINFFTSIGLGGLTDELREHLKQMPKNVPAPTTEIKLDSSDSSSSSSSSDSSSSDSSSSDSEEDGDKRSDKDKAKSKNKDKRPKTPEEAPPKDVERWGHDGFYDTYGKDARRVEPRPAPDRPERFERDKDNFVRPRDVRRNDDNRKDYEQRNGDPRRNERRQDDESDRNRDGTRDRNDRGDPRSARRDGDDPRRRESDREGDTRRNERRQDDESDRNRDGPRDRNDRDDPRSARRDGDDRDGARRRESDREYSRNPRRDDDDRRRDRNTEDPRSRKDEERSKNDDDSREMPTRRDGDPRSRNYLDSRKRAAEFWARKSESRPRDDEHSSRKDGDSRARKDDDVRSRRDDESRYRQEDQPRSRREDDSRPRREDERSRRDDDRPRNNETRSRNDENSKTRKEQESRSRKDDPRAGKEDSRSRDEELTPERNDEPTSKKDKDRNDEPTSKKDKHREDMSKHQDDEDSSKKKKSRKEGKRNKDESDSSEDEATRRQEKRDKRNKEKVNESKSKREKKKNVESSSSDDEARGRREKKDRNNKEKDESRSKRDKKKKAESDSSEDEGQSSRREKDRDAGEGKSKRDKRRKIAESNSSDGEKRKLEKENRQKDNDDSKRRDRKKDSDDSSDDGSSKKRTESGNDEGWDIKRESSLRREIAVGRYWDN